MAYVETDHSLLEISRSLRLLQESASWVYREKSWFEREKTLNDREKTVNFVNSQNAKIFMKLCVCREMVLDTVLDLKTDWDCLIYSLFGLQYTSGCVWNLGTQHGGTLQPSFSHSGAELGTVWWGACTPQGVKGRGFPGDASCAWCPSEAFTRPLAELIYSSL